MLQRKDMKKTPIDFSSTDYRDAFIGAFQSVFNRAPFREEAEWLSAILELENARGAAVFNHNWGNRAAIKNDDFWVPKWADFTFDDSELGANELAVRRRMLAGEDVPDKFAAYSTAEEGAVAFMRLFKSPTNERILRAAQADDPDEFLSAVATPHPKTKMMYCPDCNTKAHRESYWRMKRQVNASHLFEGLPEKKKVDLREE